jgi:hypothetical protein
MTGLEHFAPTGWQLITNLKPKETTMTNTHPLTNPFNTADQIAPEPASRDQATAEAWARHYCAMALAAHVAFRTAIRNFKPDGTQARPELGLLTCAAVGYASAAVALLHPEDAPGLIWDITPEAGALNGEWEDWLDDTLVHLGINPAHIDPDLDATDFNPQQSAATA